MMEKLPRIIFTRVNIFLFFLFAFMQLEKDINLLGSCFNLCYQYDILGGNNYLLTKWSRVFFEKLTGLKLVKNFLVSYATRMFITAFKSAHHLSVSGTSSIKLLKPTSHFMKFQNITKLLLTPGFFNGLFPSGSPPKSRTHFCPHPYVPHAPSTSFFLFLCLAYYWVSSDSYSKKTRISLGI